VLIALMLLLALWAYPRLPAQIPSHWNMEGEVNGWSGRWVVFLPPLMGLVLLVLMPLLRRIDPRREHYARFEPTFWLVINVIVAFMFVPHVLTIGTALGWPLPAGDRMMIGGVGLLFILLGNYMPRMKSNWWMGIRTPWTLSSESVWRSTHRLGGRTFVLGGVLMLASLALPAQARVGALIAAVVLSALVPAVWSYVAWRREQAGQ
jgi:uncharacterized membrane protein